jgi:hypothetical protein
VAARRRHDSRHDADSTKFYAIEEFNRVARMRT